MAPFVTETGQIDTAGAYELPGATMNPEWSPDGTRLAYREEHSAFQGTVDKRTLRVLDLASGTVQALADHLNVEHPRWAPDGMSVIVSAFDQRVDSPDYHGGVYRVEVTTGEATLLRRLPQEPTWWMGTGGALSADGRSLYILIRGVGAQGKAEARDGVIMRHELETGHEEVLYRDPELLGRPFGVSPDGGTLLFATLDPTLDGPGQTAEEGARLMLMDVASGRVRELVRIRAVGEIESVSWSEDGRYLTYPQHTGFRLDSEVNRTTLWRVALDGGDPEEIVETFRFDGAVSPNGRHVAYVTGGIQWNHMVMEGLKAVLGR